MSTLLIVGLGLYLLSSALSRRFTEQALQLLAVEDRQDLHQLLLRDRLILLVVVIILIAFYFINHQSGWLPSTYAFGFFALLVLLILAANTFITYHKIKRQNYPVEFIRKYMIGSGIKSLGLMIFMGCLAFMK